MSSPRVIDLEEFQTRSLGLDDLSPEQGERIWRLFPKQVAVEFPSPKTGGAWQLKNLGWAGYLPIDATLGLLLTPKVPIANLFRMLEYAYDLKSLRFFDDAVLLSALEDAYGRLAEILAKRVLDRIRRGVYRAYEPRSARTAFVRGRIDTAQAIRAPWRVGLPCMYEEHTPDVEDNRLVAWTLEQILRSGICSPQALPVRRAHRILEAMSGDQRFSARNCVGRIYSRLNDDYLTLHALCRFFLEHTGPSHELGDRRMLPFVVDMDTLFEQFVVAWLREHLPPHLTLRSQEGISVSGEGSVRFRIDLSIQERATKRVLAVLDTKYKLGNKVASDDVAQVVTYAELKGTKTALLVYPRAVGDPFRGWVGQISVGTITFPLGSDLEAAGTGFLQEVIFSSNATQGLQAGSTASQ